MRTRDETREHGVLFAFRHRTGQIEVRRRADGRYEMHCVSVAPDGEILGRDVLATVSRRNDMKRLFLEETRGFVDGWWEDTDVLAEDKV